MHCSARPTFCTSPTEKGHFQFGKLSVVEQSLSGEADSYFDNINEVQADEAISDVEENDGDAFYRLDLNIENVKYECEVFHD